MSVDHSQNLISIQDVSFFYGRQMVLENITFDVHPGDYLALTGPNGAGKTTLLKIMLGLLKPTTGTIRLFGQDLGAFKDWSKISYVPQQSDRLDVNFPITVYEMVAMSRYGRLGPGRGLSALDRQIIAGVLSRVGLEEKKDILIGELSGGQRQKAFIARALANEPQIIFLDEAVRGLDHKSQEDFYDILRSLNRDQGLTLVLVSHDLVRISQEAMHIACLDKTLVCHDSPADFWQHSQAVEALGGRARLVGYHHHDHQAGPGQVSHQSHNH